MGKVKDYYWDEINREQEGPMEETDQGGYVYPMRMTIEELHRAHHWSEGITRRDWLAGMAMQGLLSSDTELDLDNFVRQCYLIADAMIEEGRK